MRHLPVAAEGLLTFRPKIARYQERGVESSGALHVPPLDVAPPPSSCSRTSHCRYRSDEEVVCPDCGGRLHLIALVKKEGTIRALLKAGKGLRFTYALLMLCSRRWFREKESPGSRRFLIPVRVGLFTGKSNRQ
jgi:hypothetical protein